MLAEEKRNIPSYRLGSNSSGAATTKSSALPEAPQGHHLPRRSMTVGEGAESRRRSIAGQFSTDNSFELPRRGSTLSEYSLNEARLSLQDDILNPSRTSLESHETSNWAKLPLAFALLPAVGGILFKNGSSVVTDVMLLGLAAVFLHWSVTQPWIWYHSAQEIRVREATSADMVLDMEDESEGELPSRSEAGTTETKTGNMNGVSEKRDDVFPEGAPAHHFRRARQGALDELYTHEVTALASCFLFPLLGAFLLHTIRNQLTRPSEGLVSNYNLTIFLLAAEIRPLGHLIKMVQERTLHLQRVVHANPYKDFSPTAGRIKDMVRRLEELESHAFVNQKDQSPPADGVMDPSKQANQVADLVRLVRSAIQPDLEALNRAVRHYEKRTTMQALQTESRLSAIDKRLNDAISLAAAAAKNSISRRSFVGWLTERFVKTVLIPFQAVLRTAALPFRAVSNLLWRNDSKDYRNKGAAPDRRVTRDRTSRASR